MTDRHKIAERALHCFSDISELLVIHSVGAIETKADLTLATDVLFSVCLHCVLISGSATHVCVSK